ncbi:MAG: RsbRD N-terminal domain-containing protein [Planctomycetota bacterium]
MMTLGQLLQENKDAIVQKWLDDVLASYPGDSSALFGRQKDPFTNPVGHSLRVGTRGIFEALLDGMDSEKIRQYLRQIVKIRAIQNFAASDAVYFVFQLKQAIRAQLGQAIREPQFCSELTKLEEQIDRIALEAFDVFVKCREQVCELRVNEVKRRVSWIVDKMNKNGLSPELDKIGLE